MDSNVNFLNKVFNIKDDDLYNLFGLRKGTKITLRTMEYNPEQDIYICRVEAPRQLWGRQITVPGTPVRAHLVPLQ